MTKLSDDALVFGLGHFARKGSTLSFGGIDAEMEITPRARTALNELIAAGYVEVAAPWEQWPGREYYRAVKSVLPFPKDRPHLDPFSLDKSSDAFNWTTFKKKGGDA